MYNTKKLVPFDRERALEVRKLINKNRADLVVLERELYAFKEQQPKATYEYNVELFKPTYRSMSTEHVGDDAIRIIGRLTNKAELDDFMNIVGSLWGNIDNERHSVVYYRTSDNVVTHEHGGVLLLRECFICSDEEWESIKSGNIKPYLLPYT